LSSIFVSTTNFAQINISANQKIKKEYFIQNSLPKFFDKCKLI